MADDMEMREKLAKLEALIAGGATEAERAEASAARDRLRAKRAPAAVAADASEVELQYSLPDVWLSASSSRCTASTVSAPIATSVSRRWPPSFAPCTKRRRNISKQPSSA